MDNNDIQVIEDNIRRLLSKRNEIDKEIKMFQQLLYEKYREKHGPNSLIAQMKYDMIEYELLPDYLKISKNKKK